MNNIIKGSSNISSSISNLNIPSKLKKMFKLSKFPLIATFSFDPTITAGIDMLYVAGEGIINHIEVQNLKVFLQEYIDRKIDDCISCGICADYYPHKYASGLYFWELWTNILYTL